MTRCITARFCASHSQNCTEGARLLELIAEFRLKQNGRTQLPGGKVLHTRGLISIDHGLQTEALIFIKCARDVQLETLVNSTPESS